MQNQLHGMLCQAAGIFAEEGFRQEGRMAAMGSEEAAPGLTLFNLMQCVLAIDCQCCVEDTGKLFIHSLSLKMLVLMRPDLVSWV